MQQLLIAVVALQLVLLADERLRAGDLVLRQVEVLQNAHVGHHGVLLAIGGEHAHAVLHELHGAAVDGLVVHQYLAALRRQGTEQRLQQFAGAAAGQAGQRHDLAAAHGQVDVLEALTAEALQLQHRLAQGAGLIDFGVHILAAHHVGGDGVGVRILYIA